MAAKLVFLLADQLTPCDPVLEAPRSTVFDATVLDMVENTLRRADKEAARLSFSPGCKAREAAAVLKLMSAYGALVIEEKRDHLRVQACSPIGVGFCLSLVESLRAGIPLVEDWHHTAQNSDMYYGHQLLREMEKRRVDLSVRTGIRPKALWEVNTAFAVIKAFSQRRNQPVYLVEYNQKWGGFNLVGGKQEACDAGDYDVTCMRELREELDVSNIPVRLTRLVRVPILTNTITRGLTTYRCVLYHASFGGQITLGDRHSWVTADELRSQLTRGGKEFLLHPELLQALGPAGTCALEGLPFSFTQPVETERPSRIHRAKDWLVDLRNPITSALAVMASVIAVFKSALK